jgi:hypothetical protein
MGLPHWLIIGGGLLVVAGSIGLALSRNMAVESDPPFDPEPEPRQQMPPVPALLDSMRKKKDEKASPPT